MARLRVRQNLKPYLRSSRPRGGWAGEARRGEASATQLCIRSTAYGVELCSTEQHRRRLQVAAHMKVGWIFGVPHWRRQRWGVSVRWMEEGGGGGGGAGGGGVHLIRVLQCLAFRQRVVETCVAAAGAVSARRRCWVHAGSRGLDRPESARRAAHLHSSTCPHEPSRS